MLPLLSILIIWGLFLVLGGLCRCQGHCYGYTPPPAPGKRASEMLCEILPRHNFFFFFLVIFIKHEPHSTKYIFYYIYISTFTDPYMYIQTYLPSCLFSYLVILKRIGELGRTPERRNWKKRIFKKGADYNNHSLYGEFIFHASILPFSFVRR